MKEYSNEKEKNEIKENYEKLFDSGIQFIGFGIKHLALYLIKWVNVTVTNKRKGNGKRKKRKSTRQEN